MSVSTPLDQLGSAEVGTPPADEERVKRILAEINAGELAQPPPPVSGSMPRVITEPPLSMSTGQIRMDNDTARANVIGNSTPTMADFQAMFSQVAPGMAPYHGPAVVPGAVIPQPPKAVGWKTQLVAQLRAPVAVAIIVFLLNMPVVTSLLSRYASWMYLSSGEISIGGLLVKALLAAGLFIAYQGLSAIFDK
jgi:hypothetical protein